ncbi:MAG: hypothetical protein V1865_00150 [bacterium]
MDLQIVRSPHCECCDKQIVLPARFYVVARWDAKKDTFYLFKSNKYGFRIESKLPLLNKIVSTQKFACSIDCATTISEQGDYVLFYNTRKFNPNLYGYKIVICYHREVELKLTRAEHFWKSGRVEIN